MCTQFILTVRLPLFLYKGEYSDEQVTRIADDLVAQMNVVYQQSNLPQNPDLKQINELCVELVEMQGWEEMVNDE